MSDAVQLTDRSATDADAEARRLWLGFLAGPTAWGLHLLIGYAFVSLACATGFPGFSVVGASGLGVLLFGLTALAGLGAGAATVSCYRLWRRLGGGVLDRDRPGEAGRFMTVVGAVMNAIFFLAIVFQAIPLVVLRPCA